MQQQLQRQASASPPLRAHTDTRPNALAVLLSDRPRSNRSRNTRSVASRVRYFSKKVRALGLGGGRTHNVSMEKDTRELDRRLAGLLAGDESEESEAVPCIVEAVMPANQDGQHQR
jgi:hypothetical protein